MKQQASRWVSTKQRHAEGRLNQRFVPLVAAIAHPTTRRE
jgi:hypothetical protein